MNRGPSPRDRAWTGPFGSLRNLGYGVESVRMWVKQADIDDGHVAGPTAEARRVRELEQEVRELRRANEILKAGRVFRAELDRQHRKQTRSSTRTRTTSSKVARLESTSAACCRWLRARAGPSARTISDAVLIRRPGDALERELLRLRCPQALATRPRSRDRHRPGPDRSAHARGRHRGRNPEQASEDTRPDPTSARHPDLAKREFTATAPNRLWVTDLNVRDVGGRCVRLLHHRRVQPHD